jgi:hypothetical protein
MLGDLVVTKKRIMFILFVLSIGIAGAQWLDEGPGNSEAGSWFADEGPDYGALRSYFSDPIFFSSPSTSLPPGFYEQYYPYFGENFFTGPVQPVRIGRWGSGQLSQGSAAIYPSRPIQSEFRNRSLLAMEWLAFKKNWTLTMSLAKKGSSLKVLKNHKWTSL